MSAKPCARAECGKSVYPMEELKCLDQVWHKQCFRCSVCSMVLNMKNYKGYNKMPYCEAHYPKTTATVVSDTPEMRRLQEATKNQSLVKYHEEFEKTKGKKTDVVDDPETQRHKKNTAIQSNVTYHGDVERKEVMEKIRPPFEEVAPSPVSKAHTNAHVPPVPATAPPPTNKMSAPVSPPGGRDPPVKNSPYSAKQQQQSTLIYSSDMGGRVPPSTRSVGKIDDYDPLNGQWGSASTGRPTHPGDKKAPNFNHHPSAQQQPKLSPTSPMNAPSSQMNRRSGAGGPPKGAGTGAVFRAMYDYSASDTDEVTFKEGDIILNCQSVDQGWMTGTVQRTGQWGMLPANYVEKVH